jgi:hypothetical protein
LVFQESTGAGRRLVRRERSERLSTHNRFFRRHDLLAAGVDLDPHDLDQVGITLETRDNVKGYFIAAIATTMDGKPAVQNIRVGDKLLQVDDVV